MDADISSSVRNSTLQLDWSLFFAITTFAPIRLLTFEITYASGIAEEKTCISAILSVRTRDQQVYSETQAFSLHCRQVIM